MTTYLGKSCSFGFPRVPFVNCRQFMYLVISLLVLRAQCGIWLYQFLIIAYLFTYFNETALESILMSTQDMFLWRIVENYPLVIIKYYHTSHKFPTYNFHRPECKNSHYHPAVLSTITCSLLMCVRVESVRRSVTMVALKHIFRRI